MNDYLRYWCHFLDAVHICSTSSQDVALLPGALSSESGVLIGAC